MRHVAFALWIVSLPMAFAAPVPKQLTNGDVVKLFGTPTQPKDCSIKFDKTEKSLTLNAVPGPDVPGNGSGEDGVFWSPRTGREVDGDFDVTVKITSPDQKDTTVTAGLYVSYGEKDYVVLGQTLEADGKRKPQRSNLIHAYIKGRLWNAQSGVGKESAEAFSVRLAKKGKTITPYWLNDGKWEAIVAADTTHDWTGTGTVGVYVRAMKGEGTATFREFKLTQPEK